jgi:hypothetical protein
MLEWALCGYHKKLGGRHYAELMFLDPVGSVGSVVHFSVSGARNIDAIFFMLGWDGVDSTKCALGNVMSSVCFASSGICGSRNAF